MKASNLERKTNDLNWFALYTRPRFEKKVASGLHDKGLEYFLPLQTVLRQWSDRLKKVEEPLFSCYMFVRIPWNQRILAIQTHGVVRMVCCNGGPSPIPENEINGIRRVLECAESFEVMQYLDVGQIVKVIDGPLEGVCGRLIEYRGQKKLSVGLFRAGW